MIKLAGIFYQVISESRQNLARIRDTVFRIVEQEEIYRTLALVLLFSLPPLPVWSALEALFGLMHIPGF